MGHRSDTVGFFWDDTPPPKPEKAEKVRRQPPEAVWLRPDYLPGLEEARAFPVHVMTASELFAASERRDELLLDVECFPNYFLVCFTSVRTGHVFYLETWDGGPPLDCNMLGWIISTFTTIGFNSREYDLWMCFLATAGVTTAGLKSANDLIIGDEQRGHDVLRAYKVKPYPADHIDLIDLPRIRASLKTYAGRLHVPRMQELPFHPDTWLSPDQIAIVRWYCVNDTMNTGSLLACVRERLDLRVSLGRQYGIDVRSRSDAQIAEAVISAELMRRIGLKPGRPTILPGTAYKYKIPAFIRYESALLNYALETVRNAWFVVNEGGSCALPAEVEALKLEINGATYQMGIGGLHSNEQTAAHFSDEQYLIVDKDVTSYYPYITLNLGLFPQHIGSVFLDVLRGIVERRVAAKRADNKVVANSLKIVVNGAFGKYGSKYSILYSPDLMIQVTVTGQLSLLMLIERIELAGIRVISANTDGIAIKCPRQARPLLDTIVAQWERDTGFETEETIYRVLYSRDINNYLAIKEDGKVKAKGVYWNPWSPSEKDVAERLCKNPTSTICIEAVEAFLTSGVPLSVTINGCLDLTKFIVTRNVKGGAVKVWEDRVEYLGKVVRWYYASDVGGEFVYAHSGNKVPRSEGAMPAMVLPPVFPSDVDHDWYHAEATRILQDIGAVSG